MKTFGTSYNDLKDLSTEVEDVRSSSGKVYRVKRRHFNPNAEDPMWKKYQLQAIQSYLQHSDNGGSHKKSGADTLPLFKYNHIAEAFGSKKPDYLHYNPTVPLPAYYQPPLEDGASTSDLYYEMMPPIEKPPQLYPLIILQTQRDDQQQKPLTHYEFNAFPPQNNPRGLATSEAASSQPCCDYRACKIGFCLSLFVLAIFGSFVAYMLYKKYIK